MFLKLLISSLLIKNHKKKKNKERRENSFTFKNFCQRLYHGGNCLDFFVNAIWKSKELMTVYFAWAATKGKTPTEHVKKQKF